MCLFRMSPIIDTQAAFEAKVAVTSSRQDASSCPANSWLRYLTCCITPWISHLLYHPFFVTPFISPLPYPLYQHLCITPPFSNHTPVSYLTLCNQSNQLINPFLTMVQSALLWLQNWYGARCNGGCVWGNHIFSCDSSDCFLLHRYLQQLNLNKKM